jgi:hypothetical protein
MDVQKCRCKLVLSFGTTRARGSLYYGYLARGGQSVQMPSQSRQESRPVQRRSNYILPLGLAHLAVM